MHKLNKKYNINISYKLKLLVFTNLNKYLKIRVQLKQTKMQTNTKNIKILNKFF